LCKSGMDLDNVCKVLQSKQPSREVYVCKFDMITTRYYTRYCEAQAQAHETTYFQGHNKHKSRNALSMGRLRRGPVRSQTEGPSGHDILCAQSVSLLSRCYLPKPLRYLHEQSMIVPWPWSMVENQEQISFCVLWLIE
jgi:hypothetical protein